jgi:sporulation-control protein spo0M
MMDNTNLKGVVFKTPLFTYQDEQYEYLHDAEEAFHTILNKGSVTRGYATEKKRDMIFLLIMSQATKVQGMTLQSTCYVTKVQDVWHTQEGAKRLAGRTDTDPTKPSKILQTRILYHFTITNIENNDYDDYEE